MYKMLKLFSKVKNTTIVKEQGWIHGYPTTKEIALIELLFTILMAQ